MENCFNASYLFIGWIIISFYCHHFINFFINRSFILCNAEKVTVSVLY